MAPGLTDSSRATLIPAVYLALIENERILMARRLNTGYGDGRYSLVAGYVEAGETLTQAMVREAREEAGIVIDPSDLTLSHTLHRPAHGRLDFFFTARCWVGSIRDQGAGQVRRSIVVQTRPSTAGHAAVHPESDRADTGRRWIFGG